jgi:hypothetical protein
LRKFLIDEAENIFEEINLKKLMKMAPVTVKGSSDLSKEDNSSKKRRTDSDSSSSAASAKTPTKLPKPAVPVSQFKSK